MVKVKSNEKFKERRAVLNQATKQHREENDSK